MAQIREYTAQTEAAGPTTTRQARFIDTGHVGNALESASETVGRGLVGIQQRDAQAEISDLSAQMAQAHADTSNDLDARAMSADPNDRQFSSNFMDDYDEKMGKIQDGIQSDQARQFFDKANSQMRSHFQMSAAHKQTALAGEAAVNDHTQMVQSFSSGIVDDPSSFSNAQQITGMALQAKVDAGAINQPTADKLTQQANTEYAKNQVVGLAKISPDVAQKYLDGGTLNQFLSGADKEALQGHINQASNAQRIEQTRQEKVASDAASALAESGMQKAQTDIANNDLSAHDILYKYGPQYGLDFQQRQTLLNLAKKASSDKIENNPEMELNLYHRIYPSDPNSPNKISDPQVIRNMIGPDKNGNPRLDFAAGDRLIKELQSRKDPAMQDALKERDVFQKMVANRVGYDESGTIKDPDATERYLVFKTAFDPAYEQAVKSGKNPTSLVTPGSPDYMGKFIPAARSPDEVMQAMLRGFGGQKSPGTIPGIPQAPVSGGGTQQQAAPGVASSSQQGTSAGGSGVSGVKKTVEPRLPGETPAAYRARTGQ